jgi:hypothetical protein
MKEEIFEQRPRRREPVGSIIAKLAMLFAMVCTIATLVMLVGK